MSITTLIDQWSKLGPVGWSQNDYGWITENGKPIVLANWQRIILGEYWQRQADVSTLFVSAPKKSGKTLLNCVLTCYRWLTRPGIHFALGNDFDQGAMLQGDMIAGMVKRHPILRKYTKITKSEIIFQPTNSKLVTLPSDYAGSSGHNFLTVSFTEVWALVFESHERLFEELTPPPLTGALRIVDSYAGFTSESQLLERVWRRGESGEKISDEWPIYQTGQQLSFIAVGEEGHKQTWRGTEAERQSYLTEQSETLRPGTFQRLHLNKWQQPIEESFVTQSQWEACYNPKLKAIETGNRTPLVLALDLSRGSVNGDHIGLVGISKWGERDFAVKFVQNWQPVNGQRFDFDATVGVTLNRLLSDFVVAQLCYDEYEASHFIKGFEGKVWLKPFSQQTERELSDSFLHQVITSQRLHHYNDENLTKHILLAGAEVKGESKLRLVKSNQRRKIDLAVCLSMACYRANGLNLPSDPASDDLWKKVQAKNLFNPNNGKTEVVLEAPTESVIQLGFVGRARGLTIPTINGPKEAIPGQIYQVSSDTYVNLQASFRQGDWIRLVG